MEAKRTKEQAKNKASEKRTDTIGKKILRDFREFYRILWANRYPKFTYQSDKNVFCKL